VKSGPYVIYGKKKLKDGSPSFLDGDFSKEWKKDILFEERKNNVRGCVKVSRLYVFFFSFHFFLFFALLFF